MAGLTETPIAGDAPDLHAALEAAALPTTDLADGGRTFFRFEDHGRPVGYGGYELYGEHALLRSVLVLPTVRGKGFGKAVTEGVLAQAAKAGARQAYLLTTTAEPFFAHAGFAPIARAGAPSDILATKQATTICSTAALLTRPIMQRG
jgi:N-acetylglutamate synthase-like GNAT family acetyltransferase